MEPKTQIQVHKDFSSNIESLAVFLQDYHFTKIINETKEKDLILFLGPTGSGKSTCISYLLGAKIDMHDDLSGDKTAKIANNQTSDLVNKEFPEIGTDSHRSCTLHSRVFHDLPLKISYCDTAGFMDTRDRGIREYTSLSTQLAVESAKSIKAVVFVIEWSIFQRKVSVEIENLMFLLGQLLIPPYQKDSLIFLINKVPEGRNINHLKHLVSSCTQLFSEKISLANQNMAVSVIDTMEHHRLNRIAMMLNLLQSQLEKNPENVILMDVFDHGEKRETIQQLLISKQTVILKDKFNFKNCDEKRQRFDAELDQLAINGVQLINHYFSLCTQKEDLEKHEGQTKANQAYYAVFTNFVKAKDADVFSKMKNCLIDLTKKEIERVVLEKKACSKKKGELQQKNIDLSQEETDLDKPDSTLVYKDNFYEEIAPSLLDWEWTKFAFRAEKIFIYPLKAPFLSHITAGNGDFEIIRENRQNGVLEVKYTSTYGQDAQSSFSVFTEKRWVPANVTRLAQIALEHPKNADKIILNQEKIDSLSTQEIELRELLTKTEATTFETGDSQREETEKQFRKHFESNGLFNKKSVILLCSNTLPKTLEKDTLYLLKITNSHDHFQITAQLLGETPKILSQEACSTLTKALGTLAFPKKTEKTIKISRTVYSELFHKIATICGYVVIDIEKQKCQTQQKILLLKEELNQVNQAIDEKKTGFSLIESLSLLFTPSANIKPFLILYKDYKAAILEEAVSQRIQAENCLKILDSFNIDHIIYPENLEALEKTQQTLEELVQGIADHMDAQKKANALLCLCLAYQKKATERPMDIIDAFNQFLDIPSSEALKTILQKIVFHALHSQMNEQTLIPMIDTFIKNFSVEAHDDHGNTLLHIAVMINNAFWVNHLLKKGANIALKNNQGEAPIFLAAKVKHYALIKPLLDHSRPNLRNASKLLMDIHGNSLFSYLIAYPIESSRWVLEATESLSQYGAKFPLEHFQKFSPFHVLVGSFSTEKGLFANTFGSAIDKESFPFKQVTALLSTLDPQEKQHCLFTHKNNQTLLSFILSNYTDAAMINEILALFIPKNTAMDIELLAICIQAKHPAIIEVCEFLLKQWYRGSIDLNRPLLNKKTILSLAIILGSIKLTTLLLEYQADIHQRFSYELSETSLNRKTLSLPLIQTLKEHLSLSDDFIIGAAAGGSGSFFDSMAQIINANQNTPGTHTELSLRTLCYDYYRKNKTLVKQWHEAAYPSQTVIPVYDTIRYTKNNADNQIPLEGRPCVEGRILCQALNLPNIYWIEVTFDPNTSKNTALIKSYHVITAGEHRDIKEADIPDEISLLLISTDEQHIVPVFKPSLISPLQLAVLKGDLGLLNILLQTKSNKIQFKQYYESLQEAFLAAARIGNLAILKRFNHQIPNAEKFALFLAADKLGNTALNLAIQQNQVDCAQWLLKTAEENGRNTSEPLMHLSHLLNKPNQIGFTPLLQAIILHNVSVVREFLTFCPFIFWHNDQGQKALQLALDDKKMPQEIVEMLRTSKIAYCIVLIKAQIEVAFSQDKFHKPFLSQWILRLEKVIHEEHYADYREKLMSAPINALQKMAERLTLGIAQAIRDNYTSEEHKQLLCANQSSNTYHAWDQVLRTAIDKTMVMLDGQLVLQKNPSYAPNHYFFPLKNDKQRAFTRALKDALRNYFYVSRALYEGKVLMNDEGFNAFKAVFNIASPIATEIGSNLSTVNIGVISAFVSATLELISRLKEAKYQCEAGRFVQAFGLCQPDAIDKCEKDIPMDHDKLKAVADNLYQRYRDQIQMCTVSKEAEISIRLAKTDGIYVLANVMADRIFQHIIKKGSIKVEDDRTVSTQIADWFKTIFADNDVYQEFSLISLPQRCILGVLYECVGDDRDRHVHTDAWIRNGCKTEDIWMSGGILVKTGLKLEKNHSELYIRKGIAAEDSLHAKYGYCYVSESMVNLKEIEKRGFVKASMTQVDIFAEISDAEKTAVSPCFIV